MRRKDEELGSKQAEIDTLYRKTRDYLLVQDMLYKDFVRMEKDYNFKREETETTLRNTRDSLHEE